MSILKPDLVVASLADIDLNFFWKQGKRGIILDLDNTITLWNSKEIMAPELFFLEKVLALNFKICLLTNAGYKRTKIVAQRYQLPFIANAFKPRKKNFIKALEKISLLPEQVLVIGDQLFTDIWGGNRVGCYTILVTPLSIKEFPGTRLIRILEQLIKGRYF